MERQTCLIHQKTKIKLNCCCLYYIIGVNRKYDSPLKYKHYGNSKVKFFKNYRQKMIKSDT